MTERLPPLALLEHGEELEPSAAVAEAGQAIRTVAGQHSVPLDLVDTQVGPQAVRYLFAPAPGVLPAKVERLSDAFSVAVGAPVRYAGQVGQALAVEVPRPDRQTVALRDLIEQGPALTGLGVVVGTDVGGNVVTAALAKLPHLLVGGATGQGKSVSMNGLIVSLLMRCTPADLRLVLVDPKRVEMSAYANLPHLLRPIVTDVTEAADALADAVATMDERYQRMERVGVKDIERWNDRGAATRWPRIVIVIDELADLMMQERKRVEPLIVRIAQLGRAAGIHLVVATQYPKADVVTSLIKQNIPSRLALTTTDHVSSNLILGTSGAERLTSMGDALWAPIGALVPTRVQAPLVTDEEVTRVVAWWYEWDEPNRRREAKMAELKAARERDRQREVDAQRQREAQVRERYAEPPPAAVAGPASLPPDEELMVHAVREARLEAARLVARLEALETLTRTQQETIDTLLATLASMQEGSAA